MGDLDRSIEVRIRLGNDLIALLDHSTGEACRPVHPAEASHHVCVIPKRQILRGVDEVIERLRGPRDVSDELRKLFYRLPPALQCHHGEARDLQRLGAGQHSLEIVGAEGLRMLV